MNVIAFYIENMRKIRERSQSFDIDAFMSAAQYFEHDFHKDTEVVSNDLIRQEWLLWLAEGTLEDSFRLIQLFLGKNADEQDALAISYVEDNISNIKSNLLSLYPEREGVILDAFEAHNMGLYGASIPAFLALAEGVCRDNFQGVGLYAKTRKSKQPKTEELLLQVSTPLDVFEVVLLDPLRQKTKITETIDNPTANEHELFNRHLIMHGNSKKYANHKNSLKAIALLDYANKSLTHLKMRNS